MSKAFVEYNVTVTFYFSNQVKSWQLIRHRYSDFARLKARLQEYDVATVLPPKQAFGNLAPAFLKRRREGLQQFLEGVRRTSNFCLFSRFRVG